MIPAKVVRRLEVPLDDWDGFVHRHPDGWWFHTSAWLNYAADYSPEAIDVSQACLDEDGMLVSIVPLLLMPNGKPVYGGQRTVAPLSMPEITVCKPINKHIKWQYRPGQGIEDLPEDYIEEKHGTYVLDLWRTERELWNSLRRSYKSLINQADTKFKVDRFRGPLLLERAKAAVAQARGLHIKSAGRETRSVRTWQHQAAWLASGDALLFLASLDGEEVGFAYTIRWKDWAYYASGAALEKNVSHLLLWKTIQELNIDRETRYFEIGHAEGENEKERNIAFFKSGFGGSKWPYRVAAHEGSACAS